jgi:hypothetical protein
VRAGVWLPDNVSGLRPLFTAICSSHCAYHLGLAGAGDWATRSCGAGADAELWDNLAVGESSNIWDLSILEGTSSLATSWALSILLVGGDVEGDEEEEVGAEDTHARESCEFLSGALSCVWHPWPVGGGEVGVGRKVNEDW